MIGWKRWMPALIGIVVLVGASGCQDGRDEQIRSLQEQLDREAGANRDLQGRLAAAMRDAEAARQRALQLQQMLDAAANQPPTEQDGWITAGPYSWTNIGDDVLFDSGKNTIKAEGRAKLRQVVDQINSRFAGKMYWVIGHTDTDPIKVTAKQWKDNLDLSLGRAYAVTQELIKLGIARDNVIAGGQGEWNPIAPNSDRASKAKNRRVQIMAVTKPERVEATRGEGG